MKSILFFARFLFYKIAILSALFCHSFCPFTIKVNVKCVNWLKEIRGYVWDTKAQEHGKEKPVEIGDHAMDATRYFVKTIIPNRRFAK